MKRVLGLVLVSVVWLSGSWFIPLAEGKIIYVTPTGNDNNTGESWGLAKQTVTAGLSAAVSGDQVWVAAGTYNEQITLHSGFALYGGFAGTETDLSQRNWRDNVTILDGQHLGVVVMIPDDWSGPDTRIDGFTIRNGVAGSWNGGGISCHSPTSFHPDHRQ